MIKYVMTGLLCCLLNNVTGQTKYSFKVTIDRYNPAKVEMPVTLLINGARVTSNDDGMFNMTLSPSARFIKVSSANTKYMILYPADGTVFIPVNNNDIPSIIIGMPSQQQTTLEAIKVLKQLDSIRQDLKAERINNIDQVLLSKQDSILTASKKHYAISEADLRSAREIMEGREKYFKQISFALNNYLNQAKNLKDAFANIAAFAFNNQKAMKLLDSTIRLYSNAYDTINNNNSAWEQNIRNFWFSNELALNFHNLIDFSLNDLHKEYFLVLNDDVIKQMNAFMNESSSKKRNELRQAVIEQINTAVPHLTSRLNILDNKIGGFLGIIQSMNNDYSTLLTSNQ